MMAPLSFERDVPFCALLLCIFCTLSEIVYEELKQRLRKKRMKRTKVL